MKLGRILLASAVPLLLVGGVLTFAGWRMGAQTSLELELDGHTFSASPFHLSSWSEDYVWEEAFEDSYRHSLTLTGEDLADFQRLDVDLDLGDLTIQTGELELYLFWTSQDYQIHYSNEDGLLKIWSTGHMRSEGWNHSEATVMLTIPEGMTLAEADLALGLGSADLSNIAVQDLTVKSDLGDVSLWSLALDQADLTLELGSLTVDGGSLSDHLTAQCQLGDISLYGDYEGDLDLDTEMGSVEFYTELPRSSYRWDLSTGMGEVSIDGTELGQNVSGGSSGHTLIVSSGMGDVDISFGSV